MRIFTTFAAGGVAILLAAAVVLSSCGGPKQTPDETTPAQATPEQVKAKQQEADKVIEQQMASLQQREAATFPCSLFPQPEIEALAGNPLEKGSYTFVHATENDRRYRRESCDWSAANGDGTDIGLWVSLPKHFDSGTVECSPGSANTTILGIGDQAWWDYEKFFGMGTLRACAAKAMLEVKVTVKSKDEAAAKTIAKAIADKVLASQ